MTVNGVTDGQTYRYDQSIMVSFGYGTLKIPYDTV